MTTDELHQAARKLGCQIQHDCGGYRVVRAHRYLYPADGICPTASRRECGIFLLGMLAQRSLR